MLNWTHKKKTPFEEFEMKTVLWVFIGSWLAAYILSCKPTQNNAIDSLSYFRTGKAHNTLETRAQKCNSVPNQSFDVNTERCNANVSQETCATMRFYSWDSGNRTCYYNEQNATDYAAAHCQGPGMVFINGVCADTSTGTTTSTL